MKIGVKIGDIMTRNFVSIPPETNLKQCAKLMIKKRIGSLVLKKDSKLKGLITERDIIWAITKKSVEELKKIKAKDLAKKKVITIRPSADIYEALQKMRKSKYRWLPVVSKKNVIGFLTLKDILRVEPSLFEIASNQGAFEIKEEGNKLKKRRKNKIKEGVCEECGNFDVLYEVEGKLICENCKEAL